MDFFAFFTSSIHSNRINKIDVFKRLLRGSIKDLCTASNNPSPNHARKNQVTFSLSSARSKNGFGAGRCVRGKKHLSRGSRRLIERGVCVHGMEGRTQRKGLSRGFQRRAEVSIRYQIK